MFRKERDVLREIAKASDVIRRKHRMLKLGKEATESILSETFKPIVTPLQKLANFTDIPVKKNNFMKNKFMKNEIYGEEEYEDKKENDTLSFTTAADDQEYDQDLHTTVVEENDETTETFDKLTNKFILLLNKNRKQYLDMVYGVRKHSNGSFMICDSPIMFEVEYIKVGEKLYPKSSGLFELLFKQMLRQASLRNKPYL